MPDVCLIEQHVEFYDKDQAWHLFIDFERGSTFACPVCGAESKAYDAETKKWRHLDFWDWKTYMHARVPRTRCGSCNKQSYPGNRKMVQTAVPLHPTF